MKTYNVKYMGYMGGVVNDVIPNVTSVSFNGKSYTFWHQNRGIISVEQDYMIEFYPVPEN